MARSGESDPGWGAGPRPGALTALLREIAAAPGEARGSAWEGTLRPGATVGRFELLRELGRGGFGVVWEARDRELGRSVAFKAVRAGADASLREERLLREAEAAARLQHPNIVTLFDLGRADQGPYLVLELLRGETLAERLRAGSLAPPEAVRIATEVAKGVAHAHAEGVVHRDLKPENVFLCQDGQVKVLDFGLAYAFGRRRQEGGTGGYMAPEQVEGAPEDERTDVFALGVILFETLSGRLPFANEKELRGPGSAPVLEVPREPELSSLVSRMLAKRAVERPRDGAEVLAALAALQRRPSSASSASEPVWTRRGPRPRLRRALGGIAVGLVIAVSTVWWVARRAGGGAAGPSHSEPIALAVLPLANLSGDASQDYLSDGMTDEITGKLSRLRGLAVTARSSVAKYKGSARGAREIGKDLGVAYLLEGSVRRAGDRIRINASLVETADAVQVWSESIDARLDDIFEAQERVAVRIADALRLRLSAEDEHALRDWGTRNAAAYDEYLRGQALVEHRQGKQHLESARGHFERAVEIDPRFAPAFAGLANVEAEIYRDFESSQSRLSRAEALVQRALEIDPGLVRALLVSGKLRGVRYDYGGAVESFQQVVALEPRNYMGWDYLCWALGYLTPPPIAEAERACRTSIAINPGLALAHYHLARVLIVQDRLEEARKEIGHIAEYAPSSYLVHAGGFWIEMASKRPREALASLDRAEQLKRTALGRAWTAMALGQLGRLKQAFAAFDEALAGGYRDLPDLQGNPYFEPLRRDPRFARLLAKRGISPGGVPAVERSPKDHPPAPAAASPSIAVLPFADMSPGKDQEYFADGVAEEIIGALAHVRELRVVGRTSSFSFKGKKDDLRNIGRKLDAATVLEGSVRREGGRVRITAQLVKTADGYSLWSEAYDRDITGVFEVQAEIARAVVGALLPHLVGKPAGRPAGIPATRADAHDHYLVGKQLASRKAMASQLAAVEELEKALAIDPGYWPAWVDLADAVSSLSWMDGTDSARLLEKALAAADRAVALAPDHAAGYATRAEVRQSLWNWEGARADAERALAIDPGLARSHIAYAWIDQEVSGDPTRALEHFEIARKVEPLDVRSWYSLGVGYRIAGLWDRARSALRRALEIDPEHQWAIENLARAEIGAGRLAEARALCARTSVESWRLACVSAVEHDLGNQAASRDATDELERRFGSATPYRVAYTHARRGEPELAFEWLDRAYAAHSNHLRFVKVNSWFRPLHDDPRWKALLRKMNLPLE